MSFNNIVSAIQYSGGSFVVGIIISFLIIILGSIYILAGSISSYTNIAFDSPAGNYFTNAKSTYGKIFIYSIVTFIVSVVISLILEIVFLNSITKHIKEIFPIFLYSLIYLCLLEGNPFNNYINFIKHNIKQIGILAIIVFLLSYIPLGSLLIYLFNSILPLYILLLFKGNKTINIE